MSHIIHHHKTTAAITHGFISFRPIQLAPIRLLRPSLVIRLRRLGQCHGCFARHPSRRHPPSDGGTIQPHRTEVMPDTISYATVLHSYANVGNVREAERMLDHMERIGSDPLWSDRAQANIICYNSTLHGWSKSKENDALCHLSRYSHR